MSQNNSKNQQIKFGIFSALVLIICGTLVYGVTRSSLNSQKEEELNAMEVNFKSMLVERDSLMADLDMDLDEIDANLEKIRGAEDRLKDMAAGQERPGKRQDRIIKDIELIGDLLAENRTRITQLEAKARAAGLNSGRLKKKVSSIEKLLAQKEAQIADLEGLVETQNFMIADLQLAIDSLDFSIMDYEAELVGAEMQIEELTDSVVAKDIRMHTAFMAQGSYKELLDQGIIEKKGGVLGVGKAKVLSQDLPEEGFVPLDIRMHTSIPVFSKKAELISPHPNGSYEFVGDEENDVAYLKVTDPDEFWETSKYLVLAVR